MDVVWGETAGVKGQLWVLYPLLFILQVRFLLLRTDSLGKQTCREHAIMEILLFIFAF